MNSVKGFSHRTLPILICALVLSSTPVSGRQQPSPRQQQDKVFVPTPTPRASPQTRPTPAAAPAATPTQQPQASPTPLPQSSPNAVPQGSPAPGAVAVKLATDAVEFAELLAAENYMMVGEMSGIVEVANSNLVTDALAPFERLGEVPKEVIVLREFLTRHAETMEATRVSFAAQPMRPGLPQMVIRVQCADAEAARKLEAPLKNLLGTVLAAPPPPPAPKPKANGTSAAIERTPPSNNASQTNNTVKVETSAAPTASTSKESSSPFKVKVIDRSIFVSESDFKLADLRAPTTESSLAESSRYSGVRTRFAAEPMFIFYDLKLLERSLEDAMQKQRAMMEQMEKEQADKKPSETDPAAGETAIVTALPASADTDTQNAEDVAAPVEMTESTEPELVAVVPANPDPDSPPSEMATSEEGAGMGASSRGSTDLMNILLPSFFGGGTGITDILGGAEALGVGVNLNAEGISVRTLMMTPEKNYVSPIPFLPQVVAGAPNSSRAASLLPADTEIFVNTSLDLPKSFDKFLEATEKAATTSVRTPTPRRVTNGVVEASDTPADATADTPQVNSAALYIAGIEAQLNFKIRDDLLATFGSEFAFGLLPPVPAPSPDEKKAAEVKQASIGNASDEAQSKEDVATVGAPNADYGFVGLISVTDKARLQTLLPKAAELFGIKLPGVTAANLFERRGDIEYLRFAPGVAAAFIGDFLVIASDDATLQRIVATTTGERSLAGDNAFVSGRAWQPRDKLGEIYVRGGATDKLFSDDRKWISSVVSDIEPFFTDYTQDQAPLTLALSGEADGSVHELRIPRSLIVSTMAHAAVDAKHGEKVRNERSVTYRMQSIAGAQETFHEKNKRYGSLEELRKAEMYYYPADEDTGGYRITLRVSTDDFSATAAPTQYGVTGRRSFYIDKTGTLRAGDHGGKAADATDPVVP